MTINYNGTRVFVFALLRLIPRILIPSGVVFLSSVMTLNYNETRVFAFALLRLTPRILIPLRRVCIDLKLLSAMTINISSDIVLPHYMS